MTPERMAKLVGRWVRLYTRALPAPDARRRIEEIDADVHAQIAHERAAGNADRRIARGIGSRMLRGLAADVAWRGRRTSARTAYRLALADTVATPLFMLWLMGAVGVIGVEGDPADLMYLGVLAIAVLGSIAARLRPRGMARAMSAAALALVLVAAIAIVAGKHEDPVTSIPELLGLNAFFAALFAGSARLFRHAASRPAETESQPS